MIEEGGLLKVKKIQSTPLNLQKRHKQATTSHLKQLDGNFTTDGEILNQCDEFDRELYHSKIHSCANKHDCLFFEEGLQRN